MADREKVIRGLEDTIGFLTIAQLQFMASYNGDSNTIENCIAACEYTLALLKEQEARVMTLGELRDVGRVWKSSAPPYLWLDKNQSIYNTISFWCAWRDIYEMIHGRHDKYTAENYGSEWRCWTSRPSDEQRKAVPWDAQP